MVVYGPSIARTKKVSKIKFKMGCVYRYGRGCSGPCVGIDRKRIIYIIVSNLAHRSRWLHAFNIRPVLAQVQSKFSQAGSVLIYACAQACGNYINKLVWILVALGRYELAQPALLNWDYPGLSVQCADITLDQAAVNLPYSTGADLRLVQLVGLYNSPPFLILAWLQFMHSNCNVPGFCRWCFSNRCIL